MSSRPSSLQRFAHLDLLRFVAIFLVLGHHQYLDAAIPPTAWTWVAQTWYRGGWIGVDLFFVLSGFLVTALLLREHQRHGTVRIGRFLARRGLKIYPAFYALLATTVVVTILRDGWIDWREVLSEALFVQNYGPYLWDHTWSLAVEEHFYLGLALIVAYRVRRHSTRPFDGLPRVVLGLAVLILCSRLLTAWLGPIFSFRAHLAPTAARLDSLAFGALLAYGYLLADRVWIARGRRFGPALVLAGCIGLLPAFVWGLDDHRAVSAVGFSVFYLAGGALVWAAVCLERPLSACLRPLARLGRHSYSIYLWHIPVQHWLMPPLAERLGLPAHHGAMTLLYVLVSLAGGVLMARAIEIPVLRLRDRWWPSRSGAIVPG